MTFRDLREQQSLIGVNDTELGKIVSIFSDLILAKAISFDRKRAIGGGRKGSLPTTRDKVVFCLFYLKTYPTFDVLGNLFNLSRSSAHEALHKWLPLLQASLEKMDVLPTSVFSSPEEMASYFEKKSRHGNN